MPCLWLGCFKRDLYEAGALPLYDPRLKPWVTHQQPLRGCTALLSALLRRRPPPMRPASLIVSLCLRSK